MAEAGFLNIFEHLKTYFWRKREVESSIEVPVINGFYIFKIQLWVQTWVQKIFFAAKTK